MFLEYFQPSRKIGNTFYSQSLLSSNLHKCISSFSLNLDSGCNSGVCVCVCKTIYIVYININHYAYIWFLKNKLQPRKKNQSSRHCNIKTFLEYYSQQSSVKDCIIIIHKYVWFSVKIKRKKEKNGFSFL